MFNSKGQMRTVEAFLAIILLFSALSISTQIAPEASSGTNCNLADAGMQMLYSLNRDGTLARLIDAQDWSELSIALDSSIPLGVTYNLTIYDGNWQVLNNVPVTNGRIQQSTTTSIQFPCASYGSQGGFYLLNLQMALEG